MDSSDRLDARQALRDVAAELAACDARRAELMVQRDVALVRARDVGVRWVDLQSDAGMSVGAVRKALSRQESVT